MLKRTTQLINQINTSSYKAITTPKEVKAIFSKGHVHPFKTFPQMDWYEYVVVNTDDQTHNIQLVFVGPGDYRNSLYCRTCQGLCACAVAAMIDFISKQKPPSEQQTCEGCGKALH